MRTSIRLRAGIFCLAGLVLPGLASAGTPTETVGILLLRTQEESAAPLVQYCGSRLPQIKRPLEAEYARFRRKFRKATLPLRKEVESDAVLSRPATPELQAQFEAMRAEDSARISGLDPQSFCATLRQNLASSTVESIQRNMRSAFSQYRAAVRQGR